MIAITGSTGLLGMQIVDTLLEHNLPVIGLYRGSKNKYLRAEVTHREANVLDFPSLIDAFQGATTVIHLAAMVSFNPLRRKEIHHTNVEGTRNVVNACLQLGIKTLIHISSVAALADEKGKIISEDSNKNNLISSDYGYSKYLAELEIFRGSEEGLTVSIVNPSVILSGARIRRTSASLINYIWKENSYYPCGTLSYVDARDVAEVVFKLCQHPRSGERFILSAGNISFKDFYFKVAHKLNKKAPTKQVTQKWAYWAGLADETRAFILRQEPQITRKSMQLASQTFLYDNSKVQITLDFKFRELEDTLDWVCSNYIMNITSNK